MIPITMMSQCVCGVCSVRCWALRGGVDWIDTVDCAVAALRGAPRTTCTPYCTFPAPVQGLSNTCESLPATCHVIQYGTIQAALEVLEAGLGVGRATALEVLAAQPTLMYDTTAATVAARVEGLAAAFGLGPDEVRQLAATQPALLVVASATVRSAVSLVGASTGGSLAECLELARSDPGAFVMVTLQVGGRRRQRVRCEKQESWLWGEGSRSPMVESVPAGLCHFLSLGGSALSCAEEGKGCISSSTGCYSQHGDEVITQIHESNGLGRGVMRREAVACGQHEEGVVVAATGGLVPRSAPITWVSG